MIGEYACAHRVFQSLERSLLQLCGVVLVRVLLPLQLLNARPPKMHEKIRQCGDHRAISTSRRNKE